MAEPPAEALSDPAQLALAWTPVRARPATAALLALDARLATLVRNAREPLLGQMRLAWWRDRLGEPADAWPRGDPVLDALRDWKEPALLVPLVDGWEVLLADNLDAEAFAAGRAQGWQALAQQLGEGGAADPAFAAGRVWALADLTANLSDEHERQSALAVALRQPPRRLPRPLRALSILAGLGHRALTMGGGPLLDGPGSAIVALRIGLWGR